MDKGRMLEKPVAILGGGAIAQTQAADFALEGYKVRLYEMPEFASKSLGDVLKTRKIELGGVQSNLKNFSRSGVADIHVVTTDISKALKGAGLIVIAVPGFGHEMFFERMIPHLEDGQVVSIFPDNFGSLVLRKMMQEKGRKVDVVIGGWHSAPYGTRMLEPGKVNCTIREANQIYEAFPSRDGEVFFEALRDAPYSVGFPISSGPIPLSVLAWPMRIPSCMFPDLSSMWVQWRSHRPRIYSPRRVNGTSTGTE